MEKQEWKYDQKRSRRLSEWINSTRKPDWMTPTAAYVVALLIERSADDHALQATYDNFASACGCGYTHVKDTLNTLVEKGWVTRDVTKGKASGITLTSAYLNHLYVKTEVTPEAKAFVSWYLRQQSSLPDGIVKPRSIRLAKNPQAEFSRDINAARIIERCGSVTRAKSVVEFMLKHPVYQKRAAQTLYNAKMVLSQKTFAGEFEAYENGTPTPTSTTASTAAPSKASQATQELKLKTLVSELAIASQQRNALSKGSDAYTLASLRADKLNREAAHLAMKLGTPPDELVMKYHIWGGIPMWGEIWKSQYQGGN